MKGVRDEAFTGRQDLNLSDAYLDRGIVRSGRETQRHDSGLGGHLQFRAALGGRLAAQSNLLLRQPCGSQGIHASVPSQSQVKLADYFGLATGRETDKFAATGLTAVRSDVVDAPYVEQFPLVLECRVLHVFDLGLHTQFVGEILDVKADEAVLDEAGMPDIRKLLPIIFSPGNQFYYGVGEPLGKAFEIGHDR